jgi:N-acylneuraminate cytidylyltransferase
MKPLIVIPARGGSKGIPGKNVKLLGDKPLIQYTIDAVREVFSDDLICVSTDDLNIKEIVEQLGLKVPFIRPAEIAMDNSGTSEVLLHAVSFYEKQGYFPDTLILLQPTSPFRKRNHIEEAIALFDDDCDMVISVKVAKSNPYFVLREENEQGWLVKSKEGTFVTRQDCPFVYEINGAIYILRVDILKSKPLSDFKKTRKYVMDDIFSIDIDSPLDWMVAEFIIQNYSANLE